MKSLAEITETHAPLPLGSQIQNLQATGAGNVHVIAQGLAIRTAPLQELPPGLRDARKKIDEAQTQKDAAESELNARLADWQRYQSLLADIAERRKHLAFAEERLALAKSAVAQLPANFLTIPHIGKPGAWAGAIEMIRDSILCERLAKLLPLWIERETAAVAELEAQAVKLERQYGE
jgi:hypothetical protein